MIRPIPTRRGVPIWQIAALMLLGFIFLMLPYIVKGWQNLKAPQEPCYPVITYEEAAR